MPSEAYEFLPHTTDAYIQATGSTLEEALEHAAMALFDTMCELKSINPEKVENVEVTGADESSLLYNWLELLLLRFEIQQMVYSKFNLTVSKTPSAGFRADAQICGESYDRRKHGAKVEVKAVTYHRMEIIRDDITVVRFILDL